MPRFNADGLPGSVESSAVFAALNFEFCSLFGAYLTWVGNRPCGIVAGYLDREDATIAHLASMWVEPSHRRRGVGRWLVEGIINWACKHRAQTLRLGVTSNNEVASRFYERLGFRKTGRTKPYPADPALVENKMIRPIARRATPGAD